MFIHKDKSKLYEQAVCSYKTTVNIRSWLTEVHDLCMQVYTDVTVLVIRRHLNRLRLRKYYLEGKPQLIFKSMADENLLNWQNCMFLYKYEYNTIVSTIAKYMFDFYTLKIAIQNAYSSMAHR